MAGTRPNSIGQLRFRVFLGLLLAAALSGFGSRALAADSKVSNVRKDETVVIFPTCGWRNADTNEWILPIHGCVYELEGRRLAIGAICEAFELRNNQLSVEEKAALAERTRLFLVDNQGGKRIVISVGTKRIRLEKSTSDGQFHSVVRLPDEELSQLQETDELGQHLLRFKVLLPIKDRRVFSGTVNLAGPSGVTVISDIDDTIKQTHVRDHGAMIRSTFLEPFRQVPGMADLYRGWQTNSGAQIWYVSGSPWQLFSPLSLFLQESGFPSGPVTLKRVHFTGKSVLELFKEQDRFKKTAIEPIVKCFPGRRFVLVGDSGERDPEIYGDLARTYPSNIVSILIRDTTSEPPDAGRYREAFRDLPPEIWKIFVHPSEIPQILPAGLR